MEMTLRGIERYSVSMLPVSFITGRRLITHPVVGHRGRLALIEITRDRAARRLRELREALERRGRHQCARQAEFVAALRVEQHDSRLDYLFARLTDYAVIGVTTSPYS